MTIAKHISAKLSQSSWIRKMFEEGAHLKKEHGAGNVYDFSLGNPNIQPPENFRKTLQNIVISLDEGGHGYMPNKIGRASCRERV